MTIQTTGPNGILYKLVERALIEAHRNDIVKFNIVNTEKLKQEFRDALKKDYDIKDIDESDILFCFEEVDQNEVEKPVDDKKEDDGEVVDQEAGSEDEDNKEEPKDDSEVSEEPEDDSTSDDTEDQTDDTDTDSSENDDAKEDNDSEPSFGITGDNSEEDNTDDSKDDDKEDLNEDQNVAEITYKDGYKETVKDIDSPESFGAWWKVSNMDVDDPDGDLTDFDNVVINGKTYTQQDIEDVLKNQELTEDEDEIVKAVKEAIMKEEEKTQGDGEESDQDQDEQGDEIENATEKDKEDAYGTTIGSSKTKENVVKAVARALYIDNPDDIQMFDINYQNKRCFFIKANIRK